VRPASGPSRSSARSKARPSSAPYAWRRRQRSLEELAKLTNAAIDARGWLSGEARP